MNNTIAQKCVDFIIKDTQKNNEIIVSQITIFGAIFSLKIKKDHNKKTKTIYYSAADSVLKGYRKIEINKIVRSVTEILEDAISTNDLQVIIKLWNEIAENKKHYALDDIGIANEKIREFALKSNGSDIEIGGFYNFLKAQKDEVDSLQNEVISLRQII